MTSIWDHKNKLVLKEREEKRENGILSNGQTVKGLCEMVNICSAL